MYDALTCSMLMQGATPHPVRPATRRVACRSHGGGSPSPRRRSGNGVAQAPASYPENSGTPGPGTLLLYSMLLSTRRQFGNGVAEAPAERTAVQVTCTYQYVYLLGGSATA